MKQPILKKSKMQIGVAVDLGSTTVAVCCLDLLTKEELVTFSFSNPQSKYGADVITRIKHITNQPDLLLVLGDLVLKELHIRLKETLKEQYENVCKVVFSGNTTMLHILRGFDVKGLATSPFTPVDISFSKTIAKNNQAVTVLYPPGFSAFVGADILVGCEYLQMGQTNKFDLLVDLGTNGEILLINKNHGYASSTACGTVFDHAITGARYGSESIHAIANCVKRHLIDSTGKITDAFFKTGIEIDKNFVIKQENVRNFQLAKGAIYAGIICLIKLAGIKEEEIANIYISGGLGFYMDIKDAFSLKMFPNCFKNHINITNNTSLEGAKKLLRADNEAAEQILSAYESIKNRTQSVELANLDTFQKVYMNSLEF